MTAMNSFGQRHALAGLAVLALTLVSGCTDTQAGTALPAPPGPSTPSQTATPGGVFAGLKACDVLDKALQGQGFTPVVIDKIGGDNGCKSDKARYATVGVVLQPDLGIDDLNVEKSKQHEGDINGRRAIQTRDGIGAKGQCDIVIEVTKTSRAFVLATLVTGTTEEACTFAESLAKKVEPQLPKGS